MAVTLHEIRAAVVERIRAATSLQPAPLPLGMAAQSHTALSGDRFFVAFGADEPTGDRTRSGTLIRVRQLFDVELGHSLRAQPDDGDGSSVWDAALTARESARKALLNHHADDLNEVDGTLEYLGATTATLAGGAYLVTTLRWRLTYPQSLA